MKNAKNNKVNSKGKKAGLAKWYKINAKGILGLMRHINTLSVKLQKAH